MNAMYWLVIFVVLLLFEAATMGLTTVWFAGGALIALLVSFTGAGDVIQIILFLVSSTLLLILTRPLATKYVNQRVEKTNVAQLIDMDTIVIEEIDALHGTGKVRINGIEWSAKSEIPSEIHPVDEVVTVKEIQGVKVVVCKKVIEE